MCIKNRLTKKQRDKAIAKKPDIIKVWKVISCSGQSHYFSRTSPCLSIEKIHHARNEPSRKAAIPYKPGFHCYLTRRTARQHNPGLLVRPFYIKKEWIMEIGKYHLGRTFNHIVYVCKKITPDRGLLKG